jgi:hypothetical protein
LNAVVNSLKAKNDAVSRAIRDAVLSEQKRRETPPDKHEKKKEAGSN